METKTKLSKKVLSMFLSVLMALSCFSVALPGLAPSADAASGTLWNALKSAYQTARDAGATTTVAPFSNNTLNDTTVKGYHYKVAEALVKIIQEDVAGTNNHNTSLATYLKAEINRQGFSSTYMNDMVDKMLTSYISGNYQTYHAGNKNSWTHKADEKNSSPPPTTPLPTYKLTSGNGSLTTITVTRSLSAAIKADYPTTAPTGGTINTKFTFKVNYTCDQSYTRSGIKSEGRGSGTDAYTAYWYEYYVVEYYRNTGATVSYTTSTLPNLSAINSYKTYVNSTAFTSDYNEFSGNPASIYGWSATRLQNARDKFYEKYNPTQASTVTPYLSYYLDTTAMARHKEFADNCLGAVEVINYKPYVDWILYGTPMAGKMNRDAVNGLTDVRTPQVRADLQTLYDDAMSIYNHLGGASAGVKTAMEQVYSYTHPSSFEPYLKQVKDLTEIYDLTDIYDEVVFRMTHGEGETYDNQPNLWGAINYESYNYAPRDEETGELLLPESEWPIDNIMLDQAISWFNGKLSAISGMDDENVSKVFGTDNPVTVDDVEAFANELSVERSYRAYEDSYDTFYDYFDGIMYADYHLYSFSSVKNTIAAAEQQYNRLKAQYDAALTAIGPAKRDQIFGNYVDQVKDFVGSLYFELYNRTYQMHYAMLDAAGDINGAGNYDGYRANTIGQANFSAVKNAINNINNDGGLYDWVVANCSGKYGITAAMINTLRTWHGFIGDPNCTAPTTMHSQSNQWTMWQGIKFAIAAAWNGFVQTQLDTPGGSGYYTTRYALEKDMVREDEIDAHDYIVNEQKINSVISKLDTFLTSESFTKLIGVYRETSTVDPETGKTLPPVHTLSEYIEDLLMNILFNDEMINTILAALFPMLTETIGGLVRDLFNPEKSVLPDKSWIVTPTISTANGALGLKEVIAGVGGVDNLTIRGGTLNAFLDGNSYGGYTTQKLADAFATLGIKIYPRTLADTLANTANGRAGKYSAIITALRAAGENWNYFDTHGNNDGKVNKDDLANYQWGVKDYNTFCQAIGDIFSSILPVLQVLFTNYTYNTAEVRDLIFVRGTDISLKYSIFSTSGVHLDAAGHIKLELAGAQGYNDVWAPLFEALNVDQTIASLNPTTAKPLSTTFGTSGTSATAAQFANALFVPLLSLVEKLADKPIDTLMGIIPNLMQSVSYNFIQPLLSALSTTIRLKATIEVKDLGGSALAWLVDLFRGTINGKLKDVVNVPIDLNLGEMVKLESILGVDDISNINGIINHFLLKEPEPGEEAHDWSQISIPDINAGMWASLGRKDQTTSLRTKNMNSGLAAGQRYRIIADKADMLYAIITWLLEFISVEGNLSGLMQTFGSGRLGSEVDKILAGISPEGALAALVELFLPQDYPLAEYNWYQSNQEGSHFNLSAADFVYLKYANTWTREKAQYLYNNADEMLNTIVNMISPDMLAEYNGNVNEWLLATVNSMFNNNGIMNVIKLVTGLGKSLAGNDMIVNLVKDQITVNGQNAGVDLLSWYNTFGYLTYDYTQIDEVTGLLPETAPKRPGEAGYVNNFPALTVTTTETTNEMGEAVTEYSWTVNGRALVDGADNAREVFTAIFCELIKPFAPILGLIFTGTDLGLFNNAMVLGGAECYAGAIIPVYEMLGIRDLYTQAEYNSRYRNNPQAGFEYLVNKLFDRVTYLLTIEQRELNGQIVDYGPIQKIIDLLPSFYYFIQSDGISTLIKNLLHPLWVLIDTIRPIADIDLDAFIHRFLATFLELNYNYEDTENYPCPPVIELLSGLIKIGDKTLPNYNAIKAAEDADIVNGIFSLSIENLDLDAVYFVIQQMFGLDLSPLSYALEGMCVHYEADSTVYGVMPFASKAGKTAYDLKYNGADTITVTISALLDVLRYGNNAAALDEMFGFVKNIIPGDGQESNLTAQGLLEALLVVFEDKADVVGAQPNWDYLFEGKYVFGVHNNTNIASPWVDGDYALLQRYNDVSMYHSINNLNYYTDWTEDTARATDEMLKTVLDYVVTMIDPNATSFSAFVDELLATQIFSASTIKLMVDGIANIYGLIPENLLDTIGTMLDIDLTAWLNYLGDVPVLDENNEPTGETKLGAKVDHVWWADETAEEYIDTKDEFLTAVKELLTPVTKVLGIIFLGTDYRLFYTIDNGPGSVGYGDDAIVINGLNAYANAIVPIFEALGLDLSSYKPQKYEVGLDSQGNMIYNEALFVNDFVDILSMLMDDITADPVNWLIDILPGLVYFLNANGISTALQNLFSSFVEVLNIVNSMLDEDKKLDLSTLVPGIDLNNLTLIGVFDILAEMTGIYVRDDLQEYIRTLYVGQLQSFESANGLTSFTMTYSDVEERHDMITILIALLIEVAGDTGTYTTGAGELVEYNNPAAIDFLINKGEEGSVNYVSGILGALKNPESVVYKDINWNYFDETFNLADPANQNSQGKILVPGYAFQYLNYTTDWTYSSATKTAEGFEGLLLSVLKMANIATEVDTLSTAVKKLVNIENVYSGATLQKLLDLVRPILFGENAILNESLVNVVGALLGAELTQWNNEYAFEDKVEGAGYATDAETGLLFRDTEIMQLVVDETTGEPILDGAGNEQYVGTGEYVKTYAISTREEFIKGATILFEPAYRLLAWLLFGDGYEFFNGNTDATADDVLITIQGSDGYKQGLALLLEALGCTGLGFEATYKTVADNGAITVDMAKFVTDLMSSLFGRIDEILENPADEIVNLIPELLYFINAGGLQVSIQNLVAGPLNLVNTFSEITGNPSLSVDGLLQDVLRNSLNNPELVFTLDGINLQYIFELVEMLTGLEITNVVGNSLGYFYMGEIVSYASVSEKLAYRMKFSETEDFADFITILLSFIIDIALYEGNGAVIAQLAGLDPTLVEGIVQAVKDSYTYDVMPIDWFYFDNSINADNATIDANSKVTLPPRAINYLTYASDWTKEKADYVFQNRNKIIKAVLEMTNQSSTDLGELLSSMISLENDVYTEVLLNKILDAVKGLVGGLDSAITDLVDMIIGIDLGVYNTMDAFTAEEITGRTTFVAGLYEVLFPIFPILDWLLFEQDIEFFDKKLDPNDPASEIQVLINLPGAKGYTEALVPLCEALGVTLPNVGPNDLTQDIFYSFINNLLSRVEGILANPVDEIIALLPNLLYFINANGLSAVVNNIVGGLLNLLDKANEFLPEDKQISIEKFIAQALNIEESEVNINNLDLLYIVGLLEKATGLEISEVVTATKIDNFYLGEMQYYTSANGKPAFRMVYSSTEGAAEMLTVIINFLVEVALYKNDTMSNAQVLETLLGLEPGKISGIIELIPTLGANPVYKEIDWNYFDETVDLSATDSDGKIIVPGYAFQYLNYTTDWTYTTATRTADGLEDLLLAVLKMVKPESTATTLAEAIDSLVDIDNIFSGKTLQSILDLVTPLLFGENAVINEALIEVLGTVIGADLTQWNNEYAFEDYDEANTYETDATNGLKFRYTEIMKLVVDAENNPVLDAEGKEQYVGTGEMIKTYAIATQEDFVEGATILFAPTYRLLAWFLFGDSYEFFVESANGTETLIKLPGSEGYKNGLSLLLEALGCENIGFVSKYKATTDAFGKVVVDMDLFVTDLLTSLLTRIDTILNNPVDELVKLIPELIYFINAGGLQVSIQNLVAGLLTLVDQVIALTNNEALNLDDLIQTALRKALNNDEVTFTLDGINLQYIFDLVEKITGLELTSVAGNKLDLFYMGEIKEYTSISEQPAYRMTFSEDEDFADFITILLSFVVDVLLWEGNADAIATLANLDPALVNGIVDLIKEGYTYEKQDIEWFYFDNATNDENFTYDINTKIVNVPERTINYLSYASDWTKEKADYIYLNKDRIISAVLEMAGKGDTTVADIINETFSLERDLYTPDLLNKILTTVSDLVGGLNAAITSLIGIVLGIDLSAYNTMDAFTADEITDRTTFVAGLTEVLTPVFPLLDWLLFGDSMTFFDKKVDPADPTSEVEILIELPGAEGYGYSIVPLCEALGITPPAVDAGTRTEDVFYQFINNLLARVEAILANPIDEVLAILPNLIYFINAKGLSAVVMNLVSGILDLLEKVKPLLDAQTAESLNINKLIAEALGIDESKVDIANIDLLYIVDILEEKTGLAIREVVTDAKIDNFYLGEMTYFTSANGKPAFKMGYSAEEGAAEMLTIILNLVVELVLYKTDTVDNGAALETLLNLEPGTLTKILKIVPEFGETPNYEDINWKYFDETVDLAATDSEGRVIVPGYAFQYLNYTTDWTYTSATKTAEGLEELALAILKMIGKANETDTLSSAIKGLINVDSVFTGATLQKLLDLVRPLLFGEDAIINESLISVVGVVLGADLTQWNNEYAFEDYDEANTYDVDSSTGLKYRMVDIMKLVVDANNNPVLDAEGKEQYEATGETVKTYAISTREEFLKGATILFAPAYRLLSWLLFGDRYEFFVKNENGTDTLINIYGADAYQYGLSFILEALGCEGIKNANEYKSTAANGKTVVDMNAFVADLINSIFTRIDTLLDNPIDEITKLIPELIYFINAGGLQVAVKNIVGGLLNLVNKVMELTGGSEINVDALLQDVLRNALGDDTLVFTLDGINLQYIFEIVEIVTGIEFTDVVGNKLDMFYMGELVAYESGSGEPAYRMNFSSDEDLADFITILLSFVIDVVLHEGNAEAIATLANLDPALVTGIVDLIKEGYTYDVEEYDWFYFDDQTNTENFTYDASTKIVNIPERTINYLSYASDWTREKAHYIYQNKDQIISDVLKMAGMSETTLGEIIAQSFSLENDLYTADMLNKILNAVKGLVGGLDSAITGLLDVVLGTDISVYNTMPEFTAESITNRASFVEGLTQVIEPIFPVLDWLLFGDEMTFFDKKVDPENPASEIEVLITLTGAEGYNYSIIPLCEALGITVEPITDATRTEDVFATFIANLLARVEGILANPIDEVVELLPNLLYFINANGLSTLVKNLVGGLLNLLDKVNPMLAEDSRIDINTLLSDMLGTEIDINKLDLIYIVNLVEHFTGLAIEEVVTATKIDNFYLGEMTYFTSANGKPAFRMGYSAEEGAPEMLTILINFVVELVLYKTATVDNGAALETLLGLEAGTLTNILDIVPELGEMPNYDEINWNYFDETFDLADPANTSGGKIIVPGYAFQYLNYTTDWTYTSAVKTAEGLEDLVLAVLKMTGTASETDTIETALNNLINVDSVFTGATLQKLLDLVRPLLFGEDAVLSESLISVLGVVLGADLTQWNNEYAFEDYNEAYTYTVDVETGLKYRMAEIVETGETVKTYAISTRDEFTTGATILFAPAYRLLAWLLFGQSYEFFVKNENGTDTLLKVYGADAYKYGFSFLLEALGCENLGKASDYKTTDSYGRTTVNMELFVADLVNSVFTRIDTLLANPVDELAKLIPELLYFINAGGLQVAVKNLVGGPINLVNKVMEVLGNEALNIDALVQDLLRNALNNDTLVFTLDGINLQYVFEIVEIVTGIEFTDVVGNKLDMFYMGELTAYDSISEETAYRMSFSSEEDLADFITILLSFVIDVVLHEGNAEAIATLANLDTALVTGIVDLIKNGYTYNVEEYDWFYFDDTISAEHVEINAETKIVDIPANAINYLTYASDWTKEKADYVYQNRNDIIEAVLHMTGNDDTTVAQLISNAFSLENDLYTAANLNKIIDLVADLLSGFDSALVEIVGVVINANLTAYATMPRFTDDQITDRNSFVAGLYTVIEPIFPVLDWLLFGDEMTFFDKKVDPENPSSEIEILITLTGAEGYAYSLVPLAEALGVTVAPISADDNTESVFYTFINNLLIRAEAILANPVDEVIALLPNLLYFINLNGLSTLVKNLVGGILNLLDEVNPMLAEDKRININQLLSDMLGTEIDINKLDLAYLVSLAEHFTGLKIMEVLTEAKIDNFYFGEIQYFTSANGKSAFRMVYSSEQGAPEMLTIILNLAVELVLYKNAETGADNAAALETLLGLEAGKINDILALLPTLGAEPNYEDYNWNYMGGTVDAMTNDITLPKTAFINYFTYKSDITQEIANYFYDNLDLLITGVLRMRGAPEDQDTIEEILAGKFSLYKAEYLNKIVELTAKLYDLADARLVEAAGVLLGIDVTAWNGLTFADADIYDRVTFAAGLEEVIKPIYRILDWLLFGKSMEFFVENSDGTTTLIKVAGNEGYKYGLAPLLEALGVELPTMLPESSCDTMFKPVIDAVLYRVDEILNNVLDEALALLPNLFYFINAGGITTALKNLAGSVLNIIDVLNDKGITDIDLTELLGIDIFSLNNLEGLFTLLEDLKVLGEFDFNTPFTGITTINGDEITFTRDATGENILNKFFIGDIDPYIGTNNELMYKMELTEETRGDMIVLILSFALEAVLYGNNGAAIEQKFNLPENVVSTVAAILGQKAEFTPAQYNWVYFTGLEGAELDAAVENVLTGQFNELPELPERTSHYLEYDNNWNEETASYLVNNLPDIVDLVIAMATDSASLNAFINDKLDIYTNETANMIIHGVADLLKGLDEYVLNSVGVLLGLDLDTLLNYTATDVVDKQSFCNALATAFGSVGEILDLILFGEDYELLTKLENGEPAILTISGNDGYVQALAPLLSALGIDTNIYPLPEVNGELSITEQVLETVLLRVCDRIDEILANPVDEVIDLLLNLIYFINADGLTVAVHNLLLPVEYILDGVNGVITNKDLSIEGLLGDSVKGLDINDLSLEGISNVLKENLGIDLWGAVGDYLGNFYFGALEYYEYFEDMGAFKMVYTDTEEPHDFITILLSVVLDVFVYEGNKDAIVGLLGEEKGEDIYNVIMAFLTDSEVEVPMQNYSWILTEYADTGRVLSPITMGSIFDKVYGPLYTREMGAYITKWLPSFIDTMIVLLGIKAPDGDIFDGLEDVLQNLIGSSIYKTSLLETVLNAIKGLVANLKDAIGAELYGHIAQVLNNSLGVNLAYWDTYTINPIADGDRAGFVNELLRMLQPVYPLLEWLLTDEDLAFFNKGVGPADANDYVIIHGAEGYAYGIIPLLEALGCHDATLTPAEYKAAANGDPQSLLRYVVDPILDEVDILLADPINEIVKFLPSVIYFLNSNGLDTAFKNIINAVIRVLETIEPMTGEIDLYEVIGFDFQVDIEGLLDQFLAGVEEDTGFKLAKPVTEAIKELTVGEVYSFTSKNGEQAYSMRYAVGGDKIDLVTIVLRLVLTFISIEENATALQVILKDKLSGDGYKFVCSLLQNFSQMARSEGGMDEIMYTVYQIFYAANVAAHKTENWLAEFNGDYSFLNQLFATSDLAFMRQIGKSLGDLLDKYLEDIIDSDQLAPNGFIAFFNKIKAFFEKILNFFKNMFK